MKLASRAGSYPWLDADERDAVIRLLRVSENPDAYSSKERAATLAAYRATKQEERYRQWRDAEREKAWG